MVKVGILTYHRSLNYGAVMQAYYLAELYKYLPIGKKNGIKFSGKTANWMLNNGGSFDEAMKLLDAVERTHKLFGQKCRAEVVIWQ